MKEKEEVGKKYKETTRGEERGRQVRGRERKEGK